MVLCVKYQILSMVVSSIYRSWFLGRVWRFLGAEILCPVALCGFSSVSSGLVVESVVFIYSWGVGGSGVKHPLMMWRWFTAQANPWGQGLPPHCKEERRTVRADQEDQRCGEVQGRVLQVPFTRSASSTMRRPTSWSSPLPQVRSTLDLCLYWYISCVYLINRNPIYL